METNPLTRDPSIHNLILGMAPIAARKVLLLSTFVVALAVHTPRKHQGGGKALDGIAHGRGNKIAVEDATTALAVRLAENKIVPTSLAWSLPPGKHQEALAFGEAALAALMPEAGSVAKILTGKAYKGVKGKERRNASHNAEDSDDSDGVSHGFMSGCILVAAASISLDFGNSVWLLPFLADRGRFVFASLYCFWQAVMALFGYALFVASKSTEKALPNLHMASVLQAIGPVILTILAVLFYLEWRSEADHEEALDVDGEGARQLSENAENASEGFKDGIAATKGILSDESQWIMIRRFSLITCAGCTDDVIVWMFMLVVGLVDRWALFVGSCIASVCVVAMTFATLQIRPLANLVKRIPAFLFIAVIAMLADVNIVSNLLAA